MEPVAVHGLPRRQGLPVQDRLVGALELLRDGVVGAGEREAVVERQVRQVRDPETSWRLLRVVPVVVLHVRFDDDVHAAGSDAFNEPVDEERPERVEGCCCHEVCCEVRCEVLDPTHPYPRSSVKGNF